MNSWGTDWGEDGLFRIIRGRNELQIEDFVIGVWAQTESRSSRRLRQRQRRRWRRRLSHSSALRRLREARKHKMQ